MLGKLGILITILVLVLLFLVISFGAGVFSKIKLNQKQKIFEIKKYTF